MDKQCIASSDKIPLLCGGVGPHPHPRTRMHTYPLSRMHAPVVSLLGWLASRSSSVYAYYDICADVCKLVVVYI